MYLYLSHIMESWHTFGWAHLSNFLDVTEQRQEMVRLYPLDDANAVQEFGASETHRGRVCTVGHPRHRVDTVCGMGEIRP